MISDQPKHESLAALGCPMQSFELDWTIKQLYRPFPDRLLNCIHEAEGFTARTSLTVDNNY